MKRLFLIVILLASLLSVGFAKPLKYEISPIIGSNTPNNYDLFHDNNTLKNYLVSGVEFQFNQVPIIHPEISFTYGTGEYDDGVETDIYRIALNGVYQYDMRYVTPFCKAGMGFDMMSEPKDYYTTYIDFGVGLKFNFTDSIALKTEVLSLIDYNNGDWNSNLSFFTGMTFSFGSQKSKDMMIYTDDEINDEIITNLDEGEVVEEDAGTDMYDENVGENEILEEDIPPVQKQLKETPIVEIKSNDIEIVEPKIVEKPKDSDGDGVIDAIDECINTPLESKVDAKGCVIIDENYRNIIQLNIEFKYKSFELTEVSKEEVLMLADFLNANPSYDVKVFGYTDNKGSRRYNKKLSQKRADAIKKMLIKNSVLASRVKAIGMGEENPIADNDTEDGRAKNRRIEVELINR